MTIDAIMITRCARCGIAMDASVFGGNLDALAQAHHGMCPNRASVAAIEVPAPDPFDAVIDGVTLRTLLDGDEFNRRETSSHWRAKRMTPAQRAAVSAHWSAQLRAKVAASEAERQGRAPSMVVEHDTEDLPWR